VQNVSLYGTPLSQSLMPLMMKVKTALSHSWYECSSLKLIWSYFVSSRTWNLNSVNIHNVTVGCHYLSSITADWSTYSCTEWWYGHVCECHFQYELGVAVTWLL